MKRFGLEKEAPARRAFLAIIMLGLLSIVSIEASICEGVGELRSNTVRMVLDGRKVIFTPIGPNGIEMDDFFNITMVLSDFTEKERVFDDDLQAWYCDWGSDPTDAALQRFQLEDFDCSISSNQSFPAPLTLLQSITINYTHPLYPDFYVTNTFFSTNKSFEIRPSSNTTYVDPGKEYVWKFNPDVIKFNYEMVGWPWIGTSSPSERTSYIQFFWSYNFSIIDSYGIVTDGPYEGIVNLTNGASRLIMDFEKSFLYDDIPVFQIDPNPLGDRYILESPITVDFSTTSSVPLCAPFHFRRLIYDPNVGTLFSSPVSSPSDSPPPPSQIRDRKTAIIVGAVIGSVLAVIVITIILLSIFIPSVKHFFRPFSKPRSSLDTTKASIVDQNPSDGSWAKATRPSRM